MIHRVPLTHLALLLLLAAGVGWMLTHRDMLKLESIEPALRTLGIWAPIGFILICAIATVLFFSGAISDPCGWRPVWPGLGHRVESGRRNTWSHGCLSLGPHCCGRMGGAARWRSVATPGRWRNGRGLALCRPDAPGSPRSLQPAQLRSRPDWHLAPGLRSDIGHLHAIEGYVRLRIDR